MKEEEEVRKNFVTSTIGEYEIAVWVSGIYPDRFDDAWAEKEPMVQLSIELSDRNMDSMKFKDIYIKANEGIAIPFTLETGVRAEIEDKIEHIKEGY